MSKKALKRATKYVKVQAEPSKFIRNSKGELVKILYDIYGPRYLRRWS